MSRTPAQRERAEDAFLEVGIWLLFFALLVPAGFVGYAIGNATSHAEKSVRPPATRAAVAAPAQTPWSSTVALDGATGKLKWYFQAVPDDFHDWDMQLSPVYAKAGGRAFGTGCRSSHIRSRSSPGSSALLRPTWRSPTASSTSPSPTSPRSGRRRRPGSAARASATAR
jgi:hypothetical protein